MVMSAHPIRSSDPHPADTDELILDRAVGDPVPEPEFDATAWRETVEEETPAAPGARRLLGATLGILAIAWLGYVFWLAGASLAGPALAQWVAVASGPLALLALVWIMFGRTRRRESEAFTRSVVVMKGEARALEVQLLALTQAVASSKAELAEMMGQVDRVSTERAERLATLASSMRDDAARISAEGARLDESAARARGDIDHLLSAMPSAEEKAAALADRLEAMGGTADTQLETLLARIDEIGTASEQAETRVRIASESLGGRLDTLNEASGSVETLLSTSADALEEIREGIDMQAAAVAALVNQAQAGMQRTGSDTVEALGRSIAASDEALAALGQRIERQDQSARRMLADFEQGLAGLDQNFDHFAQEGDRRALALVEMLRSVRERLNEIAGDNVAQGDALEALSHRTREVKAQVDGLVGAVQNTLIVAFNDAESGAGRLLAAGEAAAPMAEAVRDATATAAERMEASAELVTRTHAALANLDEGVGSAEARLSDLRELVAATRKEAESLSGETGPALVDALVRVREAAAKAGERAREAIQQSIPDSAAKLGDATTKALTEAFETHIRQQLAEVDAQAARAIEASRHASDRLSAQMLSIGQTAAALEEHMAEIDEKNREGASEDFARRVSVLMESMNSAAIDVGKILAEDVDEKSWNAYLKGERGVFTRRAVKLIGNAEAKAIGQHYEDDPEFRDGTNRYIHDFEAMLRRVLAERDGAMIAVTLMGSDMGKLYAALAQAVDRKL